MSKKPKKIDFRKEAEEQLEAIKSRIGPEVPLSNRYVHGQRAMPVSVAFSNGGLDCYKTSNPPARRR